MRPIRPLLETLESRTLLSAVPLLTPLFTNIGHAGPEAPIGGLKHPAPIKHGIGASLSVLAGVDTPMEVGFFPSPPANGSVVIAASIDWGDGSASSSATVVYAAENGRNGYQIFADHTYAAAGNFKISTTLTSTPALTPPISATPIRLLAQIVSRVNVIAPQSASASGVALNEAPAQSFTATLGSFTTIAPGTNLQATILWGDGTTSAGTLSAAGPAGIDVLAFDVSGTHTYAHSGSYTVLVTLTRKIGRHTTPVATFESSAVTAPPTPISIAGVFSGTYTVPNLVPDVGITDNLTGSGTAGILGAVALTGAVHYSGFIFPSVVGGTVTLTNAQGSVTLALTSSEIVPLDGTPSTLEYSITTGTGAYANTSATGSATLILTSGVTVTDSNSFTLTLT